MDIFRIPDPHKNLCGSETLIMMTPANFGGLINCIFFKFRLKPFSVVGPEPPFLAGAMIKVVAPASPQAPPLTCV